MSVQKVSFASRRNLWHIDKHAVYTLLFYHLYVQWTVGLQLSGCLEYSNWIMTVLLECFVKSVHSIDNYPVDKLSYFGFVIECDCSCR